MTGKQRVISAFVPAILILDGPFFIASENLSAMPVAAGG
jgi:hypothetical protein